MKRSFPRLVVCSAAACVLLIASALLATPGVLKTKTGQSFTGDIRDNGDDTYTVTANKIDTKVAKADVASIAYNTSVDQQFYERMAALDPKDSQGRVNAARFAFDAGRNDLALQAIQSAVQIDPNNTEALEMQKTIQAQLQLEQNRATAAPPAASADNSAAPGTPPAQPGLLAKRLLSAVDINSIRQHELKAGEDIPILISTDLRRKFAASIGMNFNQFDAMAPYDQLQLILEKGDPKTQAAVKVARDPMALLEFKREIQPMVLRNCATSACHGGPAGGNFILYNTTDTATTYTNFYIMERYSMTTTATNAGFFGGGAQRKMIERGNGAHSLLVNIGLPAGVGDISHPKVPNSSFNGIFHSREDRLCQQTINWMNNGLNMIEPDYGIVYTPPVAPAATSQP